jgi:hypothetical protein
MTEGLYRVTEDLPNPSHDKRCKHGIEGVPLIKKGELVRVVTPTATLCDRKHVWCGPGQKVYKELLAVLEPVEPSTYREWAAKNDLFDSEAEQLLAHLVTIGKVSLGLLDEIRKELDEKAAE